VLVVKIHAGAMEQPMRTANFMAPKNTYFEQINYLRPLHAKPKHQNTDLQGF
jgi:hypothetical protein